MPNNKIETKQNKNAGEQKEFQLDCIYAYNVKFIHFILRCVHELFAFLCVCVCVCGEVHLNVQQPLVGCVAGTTPNQNTRHSCHIHSAAVVEP